MIWLAGLSLLAAAVPAFLFLRNLSLLRPPPTVQPSERGAAVLIPARDEEGNIEAAMAAALESGAAEVIVLDDGSTDRTAELVRHAAAGDPRLRLLIGEPLPAGWCGKNFACAQLAAATTQPVLIFADADVRLAAGAAPRLVAFLAQAKAGLISGVPEEITVTFSEQFLLPLIHFLLLGFLPLGRMRRSAHPAYGAACGQLMAAERVSYERSGGHAAIRDRIHEGLALPKSFRAHGFRTDLCDGTEIASCRMYRRDAEVWRGLAKNTHEGLGAPKVILPMTLLLLGGQVLPFFLFFAATGTARAVAGIAILLAWLPRWVGVKRFRQPFVTTLLHPVAIICLLGIQWMGLAGYLLGRPARWKGRTYS